MGFIVGIIGNLISDLISGASSFLIKDLTDNVEWKKWKAEHQLSKNQSDFLDRYAETLIELKNEGKTRELIQFYGEKSVINTIHNYWYGNADNSTLEENFNSLTRWFSLSEQLQKFSPEYEIAFFLKTLGDVVNQNRTAGETEVYQKILDIWNEMKNLKNLVSPELKNSHHISENANIGYLNNVPPIPENFIPRFQDLKKVKDLLLSNEEGKETLKKKKLGIIGMGGIGKSVLAATVANDLDIRSKFKDGVLWVTIGENPGILTPQQAQVASFFSGEKEYFENIQQGKSILQERLKDKAFLLILDDVWEIGHAKPFDFVSKNSFILITTRNLDVLERFGSNKYLLDVLSRPQSLELLALWSGRDVHKLPRIAREVARECGFLPLALAMVGAMVKHNESAWDNALEKLRNADFDRLKAKFPDYPHLTLLAALQISLDALDEPIRCQYLELAVFPDESRIPISAIAIFWNISHGETEDILLELQGRSLLQRDESSKIVLHDLQRDYIKKETGNAKQLQSQLVQRYRKQCEGTWHSGPNDGYFFEFLPYHLEKAEEEIELKKLLFSPNWIEAKLRIVGPHAIVADFSLLGDKEPGTLLVKGAISLAASSLNENIKLLPTELWGRLITSKNSVIQEFLQDISKATYHTWLKPLNQNLVGPGGPLLATFYGHSTAVTSVCGSIDGKIIISGSTDGEINVWNVDSGELLKTLHEQKNAITSVKITPDNEFLLSSSKDGSIFIWDRSSGSVERKLNMHEAPVNMLAISSDGKNVVSASDDCKAIVWNIDSGVPLVIFKEHSEPIKAVAISDYKKLVISASTDSKVYIWSLTTGKIIKSLKSTAFNYVNAIAPIPNSPLVVFGSWFGNLFSIDIEANEEPHRLANYWGYREPVSSVATIQNGQKVVTGAGDKTIRIWDIKSRKQINVFSGHQASVTSVDAVGKKNLIISGSDDKTIKTWTMDSEQTNPRVYHNSRVENMVSMESIVVTSSTDKTIKIWNTNTSELLKTIEYGGTIETLKFINNGKEILALQKEPYGNLLISDFTESDEPVKRRLKSTDFPKVVSLDGKSIMSICSNGFVINNLNTLEEQERVTGLKENKFTFAVFSMDNNYVAISSRNRISIWDRKKKKFQFIKTSGSAITKLASSPTESIFSSGTKTGDLKLFDFKTGCELGQIKAHDNGIRDIEFSPNGTRIITVSLDATLKVWNYDSLSLLCMFRAEDQLIVCTAASNSIFVAGDRGGNLHFFNLEESKY